MAYTEIEKKSLEAHVEICAVRYSNLETQLQNVETRMDKLEGYLIEIKEAIAKSAPDTAAALLRWLHCPAWLAEKPGAPLELASRPAAAPGPTAYEAGSPARTW